MPARHKNHKDCSQCGHFRTWRVNKTFVRATKTFGGEKKYFQTCNRCSCLYRKKGPLTKAEFRKKYGGSDHAEYATQRLIDSKQLLQELDGLLTRLPAQLGPRGWWR